jgi:hypothetical protein
MIGAGQSAEDTRVNAMARELAAWRADYFSWETDGGAYLNGGMAIWEEVRKELQQKAFQQELQDQNPTLEYDPRQSDDPHAADHGRVIKDVTLVNALHLRTNHDWLGQTPKERDEIIRDAMQNAAEMLEERFEDSQPKTWRLPTRHSAFTSLGATPTLEIPMSNRASYAILFEMNAGIEGAGATLPPGNSGHINVPELLLTTADSENEPDRITNQMSLYQTYEYKPLPVTRQEVEDVATNSKTVIPINRPLASPISSPSSEMSSHELGLIRHLYINNS